MSSHIPILDLSQYRPDEPSAAESTKKFLEELHQTMRRVGFFYIRNHGVPEELQQAAFNVSKRFFDLPLEEKLKIEMKNSPHFRGYTRIGAETTDYKQDNREQIDLGRELPAEPIEGRPAYVHMHGPNQWPEALPEFKTIILELMDRMSQVGLTLLRAMAQSLKMIDEKAFMEMFGDDYGVRMKVARYPPMSSSLNDPALSHGLGVGPHKDYGFLAILLQDSVGGLQVQAHDGQWLDATPIPNTFVVNIGEIFERLTRKTFVATTHRVLTHLGDKERFSIPVFLAPSLETRIPQLPATSEEKRSAVITDVKEHQLLQDEIYGLNEFRGFARSHPEPARRWYEFDKEKQEWFRRPVPLGMS